ncbi:BRCA1-associated RING domain protein 1 [Quillaja saponaria]|uniref:BRCA1-associated RING domain protein 1 n=1 Tax=Quillaja saponaria TaxID=32244 RepID=A0AAD7Q9B8_QUISA|nr:BRCA1-associated RING domain protein 1 [Quillaja saponaria]
MGFPAKCGNSKLLNPWVLQFQKMGLELKCPLCLNLFQKPMLLPCDHIFCNSCITISTISGAECAICKSQFAHQDPRAAPFIENIVTVYRSLVATFSDSLLQQASSDAERVSERRQASLGSNFNANLSKELFQSTQGDDNLHCGKSIFSFSANKQVHVPFSLHRYIEDGIVQNGKNEKCNISIDGKAGEFEMSCERGFDLEGASKTNAVMLRSRLEVGQHKKSEIMEIDMNQVTQLSPGSPPFRDSRGSDSECSNRDSEHRMENSFKGGIKEKGVSKEREIHLRRDTSASESEDSSSPVASNSELEHKFGVNPGARLPTVSDGSYANKSICSFCQSSKSSEDTGPILHYANGALVVGDAATQPNVIHVHKICIDWAPQVYFVDDVVKNLKAEVARGSKLKCSRCGLKGAALGCYVTSCRRTYHVPCAMEISGCFWDYDNFLMLCPAHSHVKLPNEKSKSECHNSKNHSTSTQLISKQLSHWVAPADGVKKWVFCGSALSSEEKILLVKFGGRTGVTVTKFWTPDVTHVIAATDSNGACSRTLKVLMAILHGRWVLKIEWIKACIEAMHPVEEEPYEVSLDNYGCL